MGARDLMRHLHYSIHSEWVYCDWVEAGEVIASVGKSGGRKDAALYFEIRHNGKPSNPLKWCRNKPKRVSAAS